MRIQPLNHIYYSKPQQVRQTSPNFDGYGTYNAQMNRILPEIKQCARRNQPFTLEYAQNILRKIHPKIKILPMGKSSSETNITERTNAYYRNVIMFDPLSERVEPQGEVIFINPPVGGSMFDNFDVYKCFVHETTHMIQENSDDRTNTCDFLKKVLKESKSIPEKMDTFHAAPKVFRDIEYNMTTTIYESLQKSDSLPRPTLRLNQTTLNEFYCRFNKQNIVDYIKHLSNFLINSYKKDFPYMNEKKILEYVIMCSEHEEEAYQTHIKFIKECFGLNYPCDLEFTPMMYDILAKTLKEINR